MQGNTVKGKASMKTNETWAGSKQVKIYFYQEQIRLIRSHIKWSSRPTHNVTRNPIICIYHLYHWDKEPKATFNFDLKELKVGFHSAEADDGDWVHIMLQWRAATWDFFEI